MPLAPSTAWAVDDGRSARGSADAVLCNVTAAKQQQQQQHSSSSTASKSKSSVFARINQASIGGDWMAPLPRSSVDRAKVHVVAAAAAAPSASKTAAASKSRSAAAAPPLLPPTPVELADVPTPPTTPQLASSNLGFLSRLYRQSNNSSGSTQSAAAVLTPPSQLSLALDATTTTAPAVTSTSPHTQHRHTQHRGAFTHEAASAGRHATTRTTLLPVDAYLQLDSFAQHTRSPEQTTTTTTTTNTHTTTTTRRAAGAAKEVVVVGKDIRLPLALGGDTWAALGSVTLPGTLAMRRRTATTASSTQQQHENNSSKKHHGSVHAHVTSAVPVAPASIDMVAPAQTLSTTTAATAAVVQPPCPLDDCAFVPVRNTAAHAYEAPTLDAFSWRNSNNNSNNNNNNDGRASPAAAATTAAAPPLPPAPLSTSPLRRHDSDVAYDDNSKNSQALVAPDVQWTQQQQRYTAASTRYVDPIDAHDGAAAAAATTHTRDNTLHAHDDESSGSNVYNATATSSTTRDTVSAMTTAAAAPTTMSAYAHATLQPIGEDGDEATATVAAATATAATTTTTATAAAAEPLTAKHFLATLFGKDDHSTLTRTTTTTTAAAAADGEATAAADDAAAATSPLYFNAMELATNRGSKATQPTDYSVFFNTTLFDDTDEDGSSGGKDEFSLEQLRSVLNSVLQSVGADEAMHTAAATTTSTAMANVAAAPSSSSLLARTQSEWLRAPGSGIVGSGSAGAKKSSNNNNNALFHGF